MSETSGVYCYPKLWRLSENLLDLVCLLRHYLSLISVHELLRETGRGRGRYWYARPDAADRGTGGRASRGTRHGGVVVGPCHQGHRVRGRTTAQYMLERLGSRD